MTTSPGRAAGAWGGRLAAPLERGGFSENLYQDLPADLDRELDAAGGGQSAGVTSAGQKPEALQLSAACLQDARRPLQDARRRAWLHRCPPPGWPTIAE